MNKREHLYRGKRVDNGEWVYGYFLETHKPTYKAFIIKSIDIDVNNCGMTILDSVIYEVIPETVCKCTNLPDKNDKLIFEDDIVKTKEYGKVIGYSNVNDYDVFKIVYAPTFFRLENKDREFLLGEYSKHLEVIGNIHDNPELLEVSEK